MTVTATSPSSLSSAPITGRTFHEAWRGLLARLLVEGRPSSPRGRATREVLGLSFRIPQLRENLLDVPARNINHRFAVAEWLWMLLGLNEVEVLARYNSVMRNFSDDGQTLAGAYGPRIASQLSYVLDTLRRDPSSRQAVMSIWTPNPAPSKDIPCTVAFQFLVRDDRLHLLATMRSSDAWLGVPYDVYSFTQITNVIAGQLGVGTGSFQLTIGSSHLYEDDVPGALEVLRQTEGRTLTSPRIWSMPPRWMETVLRNPAAIGSLDPEQMVAVYDTTYIPYAKVLAHPRSEALSRLEQLADGAA